MQILNVLALCVTCSYYFTLVTCTPVPQETKLPANSESNVRRAYLSQQFEDHTKNFILRAQERFEIQAEKRKQQAKSKKPYSSFNQLPVSSSDSSGKSVAESIEFSNKFAIPFWFILSPQTRLFDGSLLYSTRAKRQVDGTPVSTPAPSSVNLESVLNFVKEQTQKLDQVNSQIQSLASSVSKGLEKLRENTAGGSLADSLQASATQAQSGLSKSLGLNPSSSSNFGTGASASSLDGLATSAMNFLSSAAKGAPASTSASTTTGTTNNDNLYPSLSSMQQSLASTLSQVQSAMSGASDNMSTPKPPSFGQLADSLSSIFQG